LDIICADTPSGEVAEKSSSYGLSIFSSRAHPEGAEIVAVESEGSSLSIGELWPDIDKLDEIGHEDASVVHTHDVSVHGRKSIASAKKVGRCSRCKGNKVLLKDAPMPSNIKSKDRRSFSTKREAGLILSAAPGTISLHMRRSFVDRRYSPSIGMCLSEWEVILDELTHMGYIVKEEPTSDNDE
jgi:hypothetical protein